MAAKGPLREFGTDPVSERPVVARDGKFGVYVTDGETNASIGKGDRIEEMLPERAFELLAIRREEVAAKGGTPAKRAGPQGAGQEGRRRKKAAAKKRAERSPSECRAVGGPCGTTTRTAANTRMDRPGVASSADERPPYVALEGAEGCGKSTQAARLADGARRRADPRDRRHADRRAAPRDPPRHHRHRPRRPRRGADHRRRPGPAHRPGRAPGARRRAHPSSATAASTRRSPTRATAAGLDLDELRRHQRLGHRRPVARAGWSCSTPRPTCWRRASAGATSTASSGPATTSTPASPPASATMAAADPARWTVVDADGDVDTVAARVRAALDELVR